MAFSLPIKYKEGAVQGSKRKKTNLETTENKKKNKYEMNRVARTFNVKWREGRDWLVYSDEVGMTCSICTEHFDQSKMGSEACKKHAFIVGSKNYKISTITDHEKSHFHQQILEIKRGKCLAMESWAPAQKSISSLKEHVRKQLELKFRNVHSIIKNNRPISDYVRINQLDKAKGHDVSKTYDNLSAATCFLEFISLVEKEKLSKKMSEIKFFSLLMDGSTDDSVKEQETLDSAFGVTELSTITDRFQRTLISQGVDLEKVPTEWKKIKRLRLRKLSSSKRKTSYERISKQTGKDLDVRVEESTEGVEQSESEEKQEETVQAEEIQAEEIQAEEIQAEEIQAEEIQAEEIQTESMKDEEEDVEEDQDEDSENEQSENENDENLRNIIQEYEIEYEY